MRAAVLLGAVALLALACAPRAVATEQGAVLSMQAPLRMDDGIRAQLEVFPGASKWAALKHMFTAASVRVRCPGHKDFLVYTGRDVSDVHAAYNRGDRACCGWDRFMGRNPEACAVPISPFGASVVAVAKPKAWFAGDGQPAACSMERVEEFSMPRFLAAALGAFLFWSAPALSESTPFRLTGGTLGFVALSAVVAAFVLYRSLPHKRSLAAGVALFGGTLAAAARYAFGTWLPSAAQLVRNPFVAAYAVLSGLLGLALTYYYNDPHNQKINTMLRVALQVVGLGMVAAAAPLPEAAAAGVLALLAAKLAPVVKRERGLGAAVQRVQKELAGGPPAAHAAAAAPAAAEQLPAAGEGAHPHVEVAPVPAFLAEPATPVAGAGAAALVSPLVARGLILNEDTGKTIAIGKLTYKKLMAAGYVVDTRQGTITPPPAGRSGGGGAGGSQTGRRRSRSAARSP